MKKASTLIIIILSIFSTNAVAQWASYTDMIRRENKATAEYIARMNSYYNKPSGSSSVLYDFKIRQQEQKEAEKAKKQAEYKKLQRFIDSMERADAKKSEERGRQMMLEYNAFLKEAAPALALLHNNYTLTNKEAQNFVEDELMIKGKLISNYREIIQKLDNLTLLENKLSSISVGDARTKLEQLSACNGISKNRYLSIAFKLEELSKNDSVENDNMFLNLFASYYHYGMYYDGTLEEQIVILDKFEQLANKYPDLTLQLIRNRFKRNPYEHKVRVIIEKKMSKGKEKEALQEAFAQQVDVEKGIVGFSKAINSLEGILTLAAKINESPAYLLLKGETGSLNTRLGNSLVIYKKNYPQFKFWKKLAQTGDSLSIRGYIIHQYSLTFSDRSLSEILDLAYEEGLKGNLLFFQLALEMLPQTSTGRKLLNEKGPRMLKSFVEEIDKKYGKEEALEIKARLRETLNKTVEVGSNRFIKVNELINSTL